MKRKYVFPIPVILSVNEIHDVLNTCNLTKEKGKKKLET